MLTNNPVVLAETTPTKKQDGANKRNQCHIPRENDVLSTPPTSEYANPVFWRLAND
jgi:hypothetical protein